MENDLPSGTVELYQAVDELFRSSGKKNWEIAIALHLLELQYLGSYIRELHAKGVLQ